jgi:hypothetical protein
MGGAPQAALRLFSDPVLSITPLSISEDADGLLWLAAEQGVFCFDGMRFHQIPGEVKGPSGVVVLGGKTVLVAANNGVFELIHGTLTRVASESANSFIKLSEDLILMLRTGTREWIGAASWDGHKLRFHPQREPLGTAWLSVDGSLWLKCGQHPCRADNTPELRNAIRVGEIGQFQRSKAKPSTDITLPPYTESFITGQGGSHVLRESFSGMVTVLKAGAAPQSFRPGNFTMGDGHPGLYADHQGRVWIPGDYLWVIDGDAPRKFIAPPIDVLRVNMAFEDSRGRVWFGLSKRGLAVMGMEPVMEAWTTPASFGEINDLIRQSPSMLYAVTSKGVILRRKGDADWVPLEDVNTPPVSQLAPGPNGRLMGLVRLGPPVWLSLDGRQLLQIQVAAGVLLPSSLKRLVRAPDGTFFIGSIEVPDGLYRIANDRMETIALPGRSGSAQDIVFDEKGRPLVAFEGGVCRIEGDSCLSLLSTFDGLLNPRIRGTIMGAHGEIWIAYRDAKAFSLFRPSSSGWIARHFTARDGFDEPETQFLRRDRRGWIWRGTDNGIWVSDGVHVEPSDWIQITEKDGLPSSGISRFGFLEDSDGSIWIGTAKGIARIRPSDSWFTARRQLKIAEVEYSGRSFLSPAEFPVTFRSPVSLMAEVAGRGMLPIRHRLFPLETVWSVSRTGELRYPGLAAGSYQLEATDGQGSTVARYAFRVVDPFRTRIIQVAEWIAPLLAIGGLIWTGLGWKKRKANAVRRLPDLSAMRLEALLPEVQGLTGSTLDGRFLLAGVVARGGFGSILDARDLRIPRRCAIKVFRREIGDDWLAKRFQQEVAALEAISHPNIVKILGHGTTPKGAPYLVMEFIEGNTLRDLLKEGALPPSYCGKLLRQLGMALHEIHAHHIYHRDLKPENVMVRVPAPSGSDLVLIDFSMAIIKDVDKSMHRLSRAGGTLQYMAPEQAIGCASSEADLYSLAKVAIEMLTGSRLVDLLPDAGLDLSQRVRELLSVGTFALSPASIEILASALEFDPARRPHDVRQLTEAIADDFESAASIIGPPLDADGLL